LLGEKAAFGRSVPAPPEIEALRGHLRASEHVPRPVDRPLQARPRAITADPRTVGEAAGEVLGTSPLHSVIRAFWVWAEDEGHVPFSPASRIRRPRAPRKTAPLLPAHVDELLLGCAPTPHDRLALLVLLDCGVRRAELGGIRVRDFDLARRQLTVFGKGQKERIIPLRGRIVMALKAYLGEPLDFVGRRPEPDDYLLYPEKRTPDRRVYWAEPKKSCAPNTVHRWWYRMLEQAGLVGHGVRSGLNMHRARHTFATELRRVAGVEAASQALGHSDLSTTLGIYGHQDQRDLERAMEAFAEAREAEDAASRGNDSPSRLD
jgi:integrase